MAYHKKFTDGLVDSDPVHQKPKQEQTTPTSPLLGWTTPPPPSPVHQVEATLPKQGEITLRKQFSKEDPQSDTETSLFLEHLLEVDKIENGTSSSRSREDETPRGSTFITCRNYLLEQGIEQTPRGPREQKKFVISGPLQHNCNFQNPFVVSLSNVPPGYRTTESQALISEPFCSSSSLLVHKPSSMSYFDSTMSHSNIVRLSEKEELQRLNDRFTSYINHVRLVNEQGSQIDSSAFLKSAKILEEEINNLKNIYEQELEKLRHEIEVLSRDKNMLQIQSNKHQNAATEMTDRLSVESDKSRKLVEEMTNLQRQVTSLESQLHETKMAATIKPMDSTEHLQRNIEMLTRSNETLKHRYDAEQVARQEAEDRIQQLMKKLEFNEQVNGQQVQELRNRLETSTATILSLEARVREQSKSDASVGDLLKSVRDASEAEFKKYQMESETEYNRNIAVMKTQLDNDASNIERLQREHTQLEGAVQLHMSKNRLLEGQLSGSEHQRKSIEEALNVERSRAADNMRNLESKLREVQDALFSKMQEASTIREANVPLKAEIESLKLLVEEEEKRLQMTPKPPSPKPQIMSMADKSYPAQTTYQSYQPPLTQSPIYQQPLTAAYGNYTSALPASTSYVPVPPLPSTPPTTGMMDYTMPLGTTSVQDHDYTTSYIPQYLDTEPITGVDYPLSGTKYMYETSPSMNRLQVEPTPPDTPRDSMALRMQRAKSAPASGARNIPLVPTSLGQGKDYFDEMFKDLQRDTLYSSLRPKSSPAERPASSTYHDYAVSTSSAIGDVKIMEVNQDGKFVRLLNDGAQELEFGGYMLQQNVGGHPVAVYRFPPRTKFPGNSTITVWSGMNDPILHQPPSDFVWKEQQKWGTGPECTSILCRPNGQAVAWSTAAHRFTPNTFQDSKNEEQMNRLDLERDDEAGGTQTPCLGDEPLTELNLDAANRQEHVYLRREKVSPPSLAAQRHPHGASPSQQVHPHMGQSRPLMYGNDNSTVSRQSRIQSTRPDPIPGQPYAGAAAQRMGSAPLRKYISQNTTVKGSGAIANRSAGTIRYGPPTPFLSPLQQEFSSASNGRSSSSLVRFTA